MKNLALATLLLAPAAASAGTFRYTDAPFDTTISYQWDHDPSGPRTVTFTFSNTTPDASLSKACQIVSGASNYCFTGDFITSDKGWGTFKAYIVPDPASVACTFGAESSWGGMYYLRSASCPGYQVIEATFGDTNLTYRFTGTVYSVLIYRQIRAHYGVARTRQGTPSNPLIFASSAATTSQLFHPGTMRGYIGTTEYSGSFSEL